MGHGVVEAVGAAGREVGGETLGVRAIVPVAGVPRGVVEVEAVDVADGDDGFGTGLVDASAEVVVLGAPGVVLLVVAVDGDVGRKADAVVPAEEFGFA